MHRARARPRRPGHDVSTAWRSLPSEITRGVFWSPQRLAELSARDDEHSKIGGARAAQFGGDGFGRGELAGMGFQPGGERVGRAIGARKNTRREVSLQNIEI